MTQLPLIDTDGRTILPSLRQGPAVPTEPPTPIGQRGDEWHQHAAEFMAGDTR